MHSPFSSILHTSAVPSHAECQQIKDLLRVPRQEMARLQHLIDEATQRKDELQHFVDAHTALLSSARRLPDDILREIFLACLSPTGNPAFCTDQSPLLVSQISSAWRRVALSTPRLWASMHIAVPDQKRLDGLTEQISLWLSRSGAVPLSISLAFSQTATWTPDGLCDISSLLSILLMESQRWRNIHLTVSNAAANFFIPRLISADVPLLHSMSFSNDVPYNARTWTPDVDFSHPPLSFLGTDSLRSLTTSVYSLGLHTPAVVSWYTLVHLKLEADSHGGISYSSALQVLSQCHFLEYCVIPLHRPHRDSPPAASVAHFALPYLTELYLGVAFNAFDQHTKFFSCMSLPALRSLQCRGSGIRTNDGRVLREAFFPQDLSTLEHLKFEVPRFPKAVFLDMLPEMTSLRKLHMTRELLLEQPVEGDDAMHTSDLLVHLTVPDSGEVVLPQLRQLDLGTFRAQPESQIVNFVRSRRAGSRVGVARLERFSGRLDRLSGIEVLEKLVDEVAEGLEMELRYTGFPPPRYSPMEGIL